MQQILNRMRAGKFKVFAHLHAWFDEQSRYHIKDGKPVDYDDDLMSATHYAVMSLRHARPLDDEADLYPPIYAPAFDPLDIHP